MFAGLGSASTFYMTVDELAANKDEAVNKPIKVSGKIVGDSIKYDQDNIVLTFDLVEESGERISVQYQGVKPDTFYDDWEAIVEGRLTEDGTVVASDLLVKCPSKYEAMEEDGEPYADEIGRN